jgi:hypothetical protein
MLCPTSGGWLVLRLFSRRDLRALRVYRRVCPAAGIRYERLING